MPEPTSGSMPEADVVERLERFETGRATALPAAEVRRRGDRRRRRNRAVVVAATAAVVAAVAVPAALLADDGGPDGAVEPAAPSTVVPDEFPLDAGLGPESRDVSVRGPRAGLAPWVAPMPCGGPWDVAPDDALTVLETGPGGYARVRGLAAFTDEEEAADAVAAVRQELELCISHTEGAGNLYDNYPVEAGGAGDDEVAFVSVAATGIPLGSIVRFVRVGSAVLASADAAEYTRDSAEAGVSRIVRSDRPVVAAMCVFTADGC